MLQVHANNLGEVAVLSLQGQIVNGETEILRDTVHALPAVSAVKLDLAQVTTVDARGLGAMLELREQVQLRGMRFELMNVNKRIRLLLELTRLDTVFQIAAGVEFFPAAGRNQRTQMPALASCA